MEDKIKNFLQYKIALTKELREWVKDKTIPVDKRWDVFINSELGTDKSYIERFNNNKVVGNYIEQLEYRYKRKTVAYILDWALDCNEEDYGFEFTEDDINEFKEAVLEKFVKSFVFDW